MSKNVTLRLDEAIIRKARMAAVMNDTSLSQWVTDLINRNVGRHPDHHDAMRRALELLNTGFHLGGRPLSRDEIHER